MHTETVLKDHRARDLALLTRQRELEEERKQVRRRAAAGDAKALRTLPTLRQQLEQIAAERGELAGILRQAAVDHAGELEVQERARRRERLKTCEGFFTKRQALGDYVDQLLAELGGKLGELAQVNVDLRQAFSDGCKELSLREDFGNVAANERAFMLEVFASMWQINPGMQEVFRLYGAGAPTITGQPSLGAIATRANRRALDVVDRALARISEPALPPAA
jgi:hypothetical protein